MKPGAETMEGGARPVRVLFIHQNFPGQFRRLAQRLAADPRYEVLALGKKGCPGVAGVRMLHYSLHREPTPATHHYVKPYEAGVLHAQAVMRLLLGLQQNRYEPDIIVAHPGWGETLFVKDVYPSAKVIHFAEFYYHGAGADVGFDPEFPASLDARARARAKNALQLLNLEHCDAAVSPTQWQKQLHPKAYHDKIRVIHEGIDTEHLRPDPEASFTLPDGTVLRTGDPVVTYVARNLEPYRGFHVFMRALPAILERHPHCRVLIAGGDGVSYGGQPDHAANWREKMLAEVAIDTARVHFLGHLPYARYRSLLQVSAVHLYLTYPFVLSWSMLEAMACACVLVASDTAPVREVIRDGENGLLVDFFDAAAIARRVDQVLREPSHYAHLGRNARRTAGEHYGASRGTQGYTELISNLCSAPS